MVKKVLVTGATGFTGSFVTRELHKAGYEVFCFVRKASDTSPLLGYCIGYGEGDLNDPASLIKALKGKDALVNVASIGFGHGPSIVNTCREAGVKRAIFFSTTAIFTTLETKSRQNRLKAERAIMGSDLDYTIFRPTMIYGTPRDRNMVRLIRFLDRFPVIPVFGPGTALQQPVYVNDLAMSVVKSIEAPKTYRKAYNLSGREPLAYNEVIKTVASLLGRSALKIHLPVNTSLRFIETANKIPGLPRLSKEQILRLNEDKSFSHQKAVEDFGYEPTSFYDGIAREIQEYRALAGHGGQNVPIN